jgi:hypothetical protein
MNSLRQVAVNRAGKNRGRRRAGARCRNNLDTLVNGEDWEL